MPTYVALDSAQAKVEANVQWPHSLCTLITQTITQHQGQVNYFIQWQETYHRSYQGKGKGGRKNLWNTYSSVQEGLVESPSFCVLKNDGLGFR